MRCLFGREYSNETRILRIIVDTPGFIRNSDIHQDLDITNVTQTITKYAKEHGVGLYK